MALEFLKRIFNPNKVEIELNEIQALILRSRPIPYFGTVAIIEIKDAVAARQMLQKLLPIVSSAEEWHKNEGASVTLTFTYKGLEKIGVPQESLDTFPESFKEGMATSSDVVDAEVVLSKVKTAFLLAYYQYDVALANLLSICGIPEAFHQYRMDGKTEIL